jgi:hypothetical protein
VHLDELADYNEMLFVFYGVIVATKGNTWFMRGNVSAALPTNRRILFSNGLFTNSSNITTSRVCLEYTEDGMLANSWFHNEGLNNGIQMYGFPQPRNYSPDDTFPVRREAGDGITIIIESSAPTSGFLGVYVK